MNRTQWNLVLLFVVVAVVGGAIWFSRNPAATDTTTPTPNPEFVKLLDVSATDINALQVLDLAVGKDIRLEKDGDNWEIRAPLQERAEGASLQSVLTNLVGLTSTRSFAEITTPTTEHGLTGKVGYQVVVKTAAGQTVEVRVGNKTFDQNGYYVQISGKPGIYVVNTYNLSMLLDFVNTPPKQIPTADLTQSVLDLTALAVATATPSPEPTSAATATVAKTTTSKASPSPNATNKVTQPAATATAKP